MSKASSKSLLLPRAVVFVGVSARGAGPGFKMLSSTRAFGFDGDVWCIHPTAKSIGGVDCFQSFRDLPALPDCVIVAVPGDGVLDVLREAAAAGIPSALVVSEGFSDAGTPEGRDMQADLVRFATETGMAIAGPNCMGVATLRHRYAATMVDLPSALQAGGISVVSQSGGLLNAVAELSNNRGIGLNYLISIGNQAVLSLADYLDFLADDEATSVIAIVMEGATQGRKFRVALEHASQRKPVVVLKLGRSEAGMAATLAHTGTLAGSREIYASLFKQCGVALVDSIDELLETCVLFARAPLPQGDGVALATVSGGATSLIGDLAEKAGVKLVALAPETNERLKAILDVDRDFANPIDTVGLPRMLRGSTLSQLLGALSADAGIDVIVLVLGMRMNGFDAHRTLVDGLARAARDMKKVVIVQSFMAGSLTGYWRDVAISTTLPLLDTLETGMRAIKHLVSYAVFRRSSPAPQIPNGQSGKPSTTAATTLTEAASKKILGAAGLPVTVEALATTPDQAAAVWKTISAPVAVKVQSADIPHKSDAGGVYLGAKTADEVRHATELVLSRSRQACPDAIIDGVLVQEMVSDGVEMFIGMNYDEDFGPAIVLGAGGVMVEVFKDTALRLPPFTEANVRDMIGELKASVLLSPFRGEPARDIEALVDCVMKFADFVVKTDGSYSAIDLNPVFVCNEGRGVRIADALMVPRLAQTRETQPREAITAHAQER